MPPLLSFAIQLAHQAGELLVDHFRRRENEISLKVDRSIVTSADLSADRRITRAIQQAFPQDSVLSEELHPALPAEPGKAIWIIDPLDGTTNFSLGLFYWGTVIAYCISGCPELAVLHFPLLGETYSAQRGQGAFLNGLPLRVKSPDPQDKTTVFACCSRTFREYDVGIRYKARILGSASYSYCMVAKGIALMAFEAWPKIWDIAGAYLLVQQAGGVITTLEELPPFPLTTIEDFRNKNFAVLAASSPEFLQEARNQIHPRQSLRS